MQHNHNINFFLFSSKIQNTIPFIKKTMHKLLVIFNFIIYVQVDCFSHHLPFSNHNRLGAQKRIPWAWSVPVSPNTQIRRPVDKVIMSGSEQEGFSDEAMMALLKRVSNAKSRLCEMPIVVLDAMLPLQ
jgi:hypothetical protein